MTLPEVNRVKGRFVDELFLGAADLRVVSVGDARYEITAAMSHGGEILLVIRTAQKGRVASSIEADCQVLAQLRYAVSAEGRLSLLEMAACTMHLEQMSRGHYWLGLTPDGQDTVHINFTTPGYLKLS